MAPWQPRVIMKTFIIAVFLFLFELLYLQTRENCSTRKLDLEYFQTYFPNFEIESNFFHVHEITAHPCYNEPDYYELPDMTNPTLGTRIFARASFSALNK